MTAVVFAGGVLAADTLTVAGGSRIGEVRKIARGPSGMLAGAAGDTAQCARFLRQVEAGKVDGFDLEATDCGFNGLMVAADGSLHRVGPGGDVWPISAGFAAIGSGSDIALGALHMGATAEQVVEAAIRFDTTCGGAVQTERLDSGAIRPAVAKQWDVA